MPEPKNTGSKKIRKKHRRVAAQAAILFFLLLLTGGAVVLAEWLNYQAGRQEYDSLMDRYVVTTQPPDESTSGPDNLKEPEPPAFQDDSHFQREPSPILPDLSPLKNRVFPNPSQITGIDFAALQSENPDCVAWIEIPGTEISYPVMYRENDGQYYLTHTYGQAEAKAGAIHLDGASIGMESRNLLIYGHTLLGGSMFSDLHKYKSQRFYQSHPYIYLHLPDGSVRLYQVAACVLTEGEQSSFYLCDFADDTSAQAYYDQFMEQSLYPTGVFVNAGSGKQTLVLSTCTRKIYRRLILAIEV